jgi:hypothetical protein
MPEFEQVMQWLRQQKSVDFVTTLQGGQTILIMTKSEKLVEDLRKRGATTRWYDRTEFSTKSGKSKASFQCEVLLGPAFWKQAA